MKDLTSYTTFGVPASCEDYIYILNSEDVAGILPRLAARPHFVLGGGSNVLFTRHFDGVVVHLGTKGMTVREETDEFVCVEVEAGEKWEDFVNYCVAQRWYGVENLVGIPGLVGSCPVQNIGAYGAEVKDVISEVKGWRISSAQPFALTNAQCGFGYRNSIFKNEWKNDAIITSVCFRLSKVERYNLTYKALSDALAAKSVAPTLENIAQTVIEVRNSKLPDIREVGCAGSFFKNPVVKEEVRDALLARFPNLVSYPAGAGFCKLAAGQLIDLSGMKGVREGAVGVWPKQALVLVNYGGATGAQVREFYQCVQRKVESLTGVRIEPEVNIL